jgi:hypothetical protein
MENKEHKNEPPEKSAVVNLILKRTVYSETTEYSLFEIISLTVPNSR